MNIGRGQSSGDGSMAGQIVNPANGAPVPYADVTIEVDGAPQTRGVVRARADGRFLFHAVPAGRYRLMASKHGYVPAQYGAARPGAGGQVVSLAAGEHKSGLVIGLRHLGIVRGTVTGPGGLGAFSVTVSAYRREYPDGMPVWTRASSSLTDGRGQYRLHHLQPGSYVITAEAAPGTIPPALGGTASSPPAEPVLTYFPAATSITGATVVSVPLGGVLRGLDIRLQDAPAAHLKLRAGFPPGTAPATRANNIDLPSYLSVQIVSAQDGVPATMFSGIAGTQFHPAPGALAPGGYILTGIEQSTGRCFAVHQEVTVPSGTTSLTLPVSRCVDLPGRVRFSGGPAALRGMIIRLSSEQWGPRANRVASVDEHGSFLIKDIPPGRWTVRVPHLPIRAYVHSIRLGETNALTGQIVVDESTKGALDIGISTSGARLEGDVVTGRATNVLAVRQLPLADVSARFATAVVRPDGDFSFPILAPGVYQIYAFEDFEPLAWLEPGFLSTYSDHTMKVDLPEGGAARIHIRAIPAAPERQVQ